MCAQALGNISRDPLPRIPRVLAALRERRVGIEKYTGHISRDVRETVLVRRRFSEGGPVSRRPDPSNRLTLPVEPAERSLRALRQRGGRCVFRTEHSLAVYCTPYLPSANTDERHDGETGGNCHTRKTPEVPGFVAHGC